MYSCEGEIIYFVFQRMRLPFLKTQIKNLCPRQGLKIAGVVLHRVGIFGFFVLNRVRVKLGIPIPKYWLSTPLPPPPGT